jgi:anti-sigma regulatory factor (Ser/Thr protein kinase)
MDIYSKKSTWKVYLAIAGIVIVILSLLYTNYLTQRLAASERNYAAIWGDATLLLTNVDINEDLSLPTKIIRGNATIPVILVNLQGGIDYAINFGEQLDNDKKYLADQVKKMDKNGFVPIDIPGFGKLYYQESSTLRLLRYFPFVQLVLISAFIAFGYLGFSSARRSEQNRVWVGMAKETAHQLGTPISGMVAWIEHLKEIRQDDEGVHEILNELRNDVGRLELIADRFSKIGSIPSLEPLNIYPELENCRVYMQRRAPRKVHFHFPDPHTHPLLVRLNAPLFEWVIENLLRNALDSMEAHGSITVEVFNEDKTIAIEVTDTGKGIPASKFKTVFQPGFTTKKRGWGLGLSLSKRIIEDYHNGRIFVKRSEENKGTTFCIRLLKATEE